MAEPDCTLCEAQGWRACDACGSPVTDGYRSPLGLDTCGYCRERPAERPSAAL